MKMLIIIAMMLFVSNVFAAEEKLMIIVRRDTVLGMEEVSFVRENGKIEAASNTNFLTKSFPYHFGAYDLVATPEINKLISLAATEQSKPLAKEIFLSHHDMTVYVNEKKIPANSTQFGAALAAIKSVFESKDLKLVDGLTVHNADDIKKISCESKKDKTCIFKYGYLHE
jgi:hypothetical protein